MKNQTQTETARRISVKETLSRAGFPNLTAFLEDDAALDSVQPALCSEGCEVEPDGTCPHGHPALTRAIGLV